MPCQNVFQAEIQDVEDHPAQKYYFRKIEFPVFVKFCYCIGSIEMIHQKLLTAC
jgi:hypothetical protein